MLTLLLPTRGISLDGGFTVTFDNVSEEGWSKHYTLEDVRNGVREEIEINGIDYVVIVGQKTIVKQLVRAKRSRNLYFIENNVSCAYLQMSASVTKQQIHHHFRNRVVSLPSCV